jgi:hypothetical protein
MYTLQQKGWVWHQFKSISRRFTKAAKAIFYALAKQNLAQAANFQSNSLIVKKSGQQIITFSLL